MLEIFGKKYVASKEAAALLGHSKSWLEKMRGVKKSPPYMQIHGKGKVYYDYEKLKEWIEKNKKEVY
jgi:hypothetical protein